MRSYPSLYGSRHPLLSITHGVHNHQSVYAGMSISLVTCK